MSKGARIQGRASVIGRVPRAPRRQRRGEQPLKWVPTASREKGGETPRIPCGQLGGNDRELHTQGTSG